MKKYILLLIIAFVASYADAASKYRITADAPDAVAVGDQFRLTYTVNTSEKVKNFMASSGFDGFEVLMGPSRSTSSSTQIINGNVTSSSSITFTYILMASKEGTYTIPAATVEVDGNKLISNSVKIKVLPQDKKSSNTGNSQSNGRGRVSNSTAQINSDDLFITATANKVNVYEQETILLTYKIYTTVDLRGFENVKLPDFKGFHSQEIELPQTKQFSLEHYKGRNYHTMVYRQFLLFPQKTGKIEIGQARFDASVARAVQSNDPFDAFFGGTSYVSVKKTLMTSPININVKSLPGNKPDDFVGAVGAFSLSSSIDKKTVDANDAVTLKITLSGVGNLKLVEAPKIEFPADFEVYDPKIDEKFTIKNNGMTGSKVFEYLIIPRHEGKFKIPEVKLSYFDIKSGSYKTLTTESYDITVNKGKGDGKYVDYASYQKEDVKMLASDIKYIKVGDVKLYKEDNFIITKVWYYLVYVILFVIFIAFVLVYRRRMQESLNIAKSRNKKANKVATLRMKSAQKLMKQNNSEVFYDEVLKALWGYIADKLNMNISDLNKDKIKDKMQEASISDELIERFIKLLNDCEFARYAPGNKSDGMDNIYHSAVELISSIENNIKK